MIFLFVQVTYAQWVFKDIPGQDINITNCQFYTEPCQQPPEFPVPRRAASGILYTTWQKADVDNLCPGNLCGPFCNHTDESCFIKYRIPKDPNDPTLGGRTLVNGTNSTSDASGSLEDAYCPPDCCNTENCRRYRDIEGQPVPVNHEVMLVFGGVALRNVTVNGTLLYNNCNEDTIKLARKLYGLEVTESCGLELLNEIWRYDVQDNLWTYIKPTYLPTLANYSFPFPRHSHASVLVEIQEVDESTKLLQLKKFMYVYGGFALECRDACEDMWRFEIPWAAQSYYPEAVGGFWNRAGYWEELINSYSPGRRMGHTMAVTPDYSNIYLYGGLGNNTLYNDLWRYNVRDRTWEKLITYGIKSVTRTIKLWNETDYQLSLEIEEMRLNDTIIYSASGSIPKPRMWHCMLYFDSDIDYIFLFGGLGTRVRVFELGNASVVYDDLWVFSLKSQKWTVIKSDTPGPAARYEANIIQLDKQRFAVYGGRHNEEVFDDFWVYNIDTNHWYNWTELLKAQNSSYPSGRFKGILMKTSQGMIVYSGSHTNMTDLSQTDLSTEDYITYVAECQGILSRYKVSLTSIGQKFFSSEQQLLYAATNSSCFLRNTPLPSYVGTIEFLQGVWFFNLTFCAENCNGRGYCEYGTCYCDPEYYGLTCENTACTGSFCIYDNEFFASSECYHCSGYGTCIEGTCNCTEGYYGEDCSMQNCLNNCSGNGDCLNMYPISQCDCYGKFGGDDCSAVLCLNNCNEPKGTCNRTTGECTCVAGFYGIDCSVVGFSSGKFLNFVLSAIYLLTF